MQAVWVEACWNTKLSVDCSKYNRNFFVDFMKFKLW
jgi:hypothetical protein